MLDLLIINGHVIDPKNNVDEVRPIAIYGGKITKYEEGEEAKHVIDAKGKYVFPGLIDSHAHMFQDGTDIGLYPDTAYIPTGVTSAIDFTAGVSNYNIFRQAVIARSKVRIKSFLQVCSAGLVTTSYHECINPKYFNPEKMDRIFKENKDNILGLKIRQSEELAEGLGIQPLIATIDIANKIGCPVEVHCTNIPVPTSEVLELLRPGDIFQHVYQGVKNTIIDENGKLYDCVLESRKRGIIFDTAEGRKHGDFEVMTKAMEQGFIADMCSTDLVLGSMYRRPIFSLPNLMSRYLCMGISLNEVVKMTTERPAKLMNMENEIGCLSEGAYADVSIFDIMDKQQLYRDWKGSTFLADKLLKPEMTIKDGYIMYCAPDYIYEN
ncbi:MULTISPECIES: amidohydrolase family protein [Clostridium]|uniref:Amidohydrolase n=1 Tax=Clostridium saccharoperbutylacetonicum N1-4(HMT) TaxID=931276 RepID=M1N5U5_9CLOT|nr:MULTISPECIES: amidohydrolase family protein [Clostridium]AGF58752.1 amidohydrolase [Clostridium saccharoperbutylacetonicum N1-4(HMT)]AQR97444.1 deacetylase [Clostridium saccharoperbutylacetonicum]NRT60469.1 putative amidohydrolase [Clostridium saccharoperbutylacetonicum]NSB23782.1 putative amidohydrolase [Clostridium saccharoperbutylacetonicum]NSB33328.1 putative amidohydrolase [Clostridium saccharoperbutylacetonicum]